MHWAPAGLIRRTPTVNIVERRVSIVTRRSRKRRMRPFKNVEEPMSSNRVVHQPTEMLTAPRRATSLPAHVKMCALPRKYPARLSHGEGQPVQSPARVYINGVALFDALEAAEIPSLQVVPRQGVAGLKEN